MNLVPNPTISFSLDGVDYEIDLGAKNRDKFYERITPYVEAGRRVRGGRRTAGGGARVARSSAHAGSGTGSGLSRDETAAIRLWAQQNGRTVSTRGRLPADLVSAYRSAKH